MSNKTIIVLIILSLCLCSCVSISVDTAFRRAWNKATPEHRKGYIELKPVLTKEQADSFLRMMDKKEREEGLE